VKVRLLLAALLGSFGGARAVPHVHRVPELKAHQEEKPRRGINFTRQESRLLETSLSLRLHWGFERSEAELASNVQEDKFVLNELDGTTHNSTRRYHDGAASFNDAPSLHRYNWVRGGPLRYTDPSGNCYDFAGGTGFSLGMCKLSAEAFGGALIGLGRVALGVGEGFVNMASPGLIDNIKNVGTTQDERIADPFVRLHRIDENVSGEVAPLLAFLRELQRRHHLAVLLVHHARKGGAKMRAGQALRGSSEFHAWGDSNLYLRRNNEQLTLSVEHRAAPSIPNISLQLTDVDDAVALAIAERRLAPPGVVGGDVEDDGELSDELSVEEQLAALVLRGEALGGVKAGGHLHLGDAACLAKDGEPLADGVRTV
jgi:hypothetical protein